MSLSISPLAYACRTQKVADDASFDTLPIEFASQEDTEELSFDFGSIRSQNHSFSYVFRNIADIDYR
jgi:hypothetical protein